MKVFLRSLIILTVVVSLQAHSLAPGFSTADAEPSVEQVTTEIDALIAEAEDDLKVPISLGPWVIVHGILAFPDTLHVTKKEDETSVLALDWLRKGGLALGKPIFVTTPNGIASPAHTPGNEKTREVLEGHPHQFFGYLSDLGLPMTTPWMAHDGKRWVEKSFGDLLLDAKAVAGVNTQPKFVYEPTWILWGLSRHVKRDEVWTNRQGGKWSIARLVDYEVRAGIDHDKTACGGMHRLYAIDLALKEAVKREDKWVSSALFQGATGFVQKHVAQLRNEQNRDGSLSGRLLRGPGMADSWHTRINSNGHSVEFLAQSLTLEQMKQPWFLRSAQVLARDLSMVDENEIGLGALFHAYHALRLVSERLR